MTARAEDGWKQTVRLPAEIGCCFECPFFSSKTERVWTGDCCDTYRCKRAGIAITPSDGVQPPPTWCPLRLPADRPCSCKKFGWPEGQHGPACEKKQP